MIINNVSSDLTLVSCGIPQWSVLGPILSLIYINDFHHCSCLFEFHLFADDANLFYRHRNLDTLKQIIIIIIIKAYTAPIHSVLSALQ